MPRQSPDFNLHGTTWTTARARQLVRATALLVCGLLAGCDLSPASRSWDRYPSQIDKLANPVPPTPLIASQRRGRIVYEHYCQICHGEHGQGDGFNSALLSIPPRNFADRTFWKRATEQKLTKTIAEGGKSVAKSNLMPAWGHTLDAEKIQDVIAYLRTFAASTAQQAANASSPPAK